MLPTMRTVKYDKTLDQEDRKTLEDAKRILKYDTNKGYLLQKLLDADIIPFDPQAVADYKQRAADDLVKNNIYTQWNKLKNRVSVSFTIALLTTMIGITVMVVSLNTIGMFLWQVVPGILGAWYIFFWFLNKQKNLEEANPNLKNNSSIYRVEAKWTLIPIEDYKNYVPLGVLELAMEASKFGPIYIEELQLTQRVTPDPFLVIKMYSECYHIAVWREPGFKVQFYEAAKG